MKALTIIGFIIAVIAITFSILAFVANKITLSHIRQHEKEAETRLNNLSDAIRVHAIDKDLHKTESRKSKK